MLTSGTTNESIRNCARPRRRYGKSRRRYLLDENGGMRQRLAAVLDRNGKFHIRGLGLNVVSKILAVHDSQKWPVFNGPVEETLHHFGYEPPRGVGKVGRYLKFAEVME